MTGASSESSSYLDFGLNLLAGLLLLLLFIMPIGFGVGLVGLEFEELPFRLPYLFGGVYTGSGEGDVVFTSKLPNSTLARALARIALNSDDRVVLN